MFESHVCKESQNFSPTWGLVGYPQPGWEQPAGAGLHWEALSPGSQQECSDGWAMPVTGNEDRVKGHLPHIHHSVSSPALSFDRRGNWDIERRVGPDPQATFFPLVSATARSNVVYLFFYISQNLLRKGWPGMRPWRHPSDLPSCDKAVGSTDRQDLHGTHLGSQEVVRWFWELGSELWCLKWLTRDKNRDRQTKCTKISQ